MSAVDELERLTSLGKKLGYAGVELRKWVTEQMKIAEEKSKADQERETRRLERQTQQEEIAAKAKQEIEERQAKQQAEERQKQQQFEQEKLHWKAKMQAEERHQQQQWEKEKLDREEAREKEKAEREEALKQLEIQQKREEMESRERIRMRELELQQERLTRTDREPENDDGNDSASSHGSAASSTRRRSRAGPKLPYFDDAKDNIDSYLRRFERYAELQGWPTQEWAIYLSALLKGNALEVYSRLAETESKSYDKLKSALLRKYDLTVDGFRKRFYDARRERDETAAQFVCRLVGYLDRWVQLAKIEQTYEGLKDLIVREQFMAVSEEKLTLYLRE